MLWINGLPRAVALRRNMGTAPHDMRHGFSGLEDNGVQTGKTVREQGDNAEAWIRFPGCRAAFAGFERIEALDTVALPFNSLPAVE
jgi:hypothetical protein